MKKIFNRLLLCHLFIHWNRNRFYFLNKPKLHFVYPEIETLESIHRNKKIEDQAKMKEILNILNQRNKKDEIRKYSDAPKIGSEKLQFTFIFIEQELYNLVYKKE